jgi:hypothetical protein
MFLGHRDAFPVNGQRLGGLTQLGKRLAQQLPRGGVAAVQLQRLPQVCDRHARVARLEVLRPQPEAQQGAILARSEQLFEVGDRGVRHRRFPVHAVCRDGIDRRDATIRR